MGRGGPNPQGCLTTHCPRCGSEIQAATLSALQKRVRGCCRQGRTDKRPARSNLPPPPVPVTFRLNRLISSQNKTTYSHWTVHHRDKRAWKKVIAVQLASLRGLYLPYSEWHIERVYAHPKREMDFANLVGGAKPLIDCLSEEGIIVDDAPRYFTCTYKQRRGESNHTELTLVGYTHETNDVRELPRPEGGGR